MKPVILEGKRIVLRPLKMSDTKVLWKNMNDPCVNKYLDSRDGVSLKKEKEFVKKTINDWKKGEELTWGVEHRQSKKIIGCCALHVKKRDNRASFGLWIDKKFHGQGFGKEMAMLAMNFGFKKLELNRIEYSLFAPNKASKALIEKLGGKFEGRRRQFVKVGKSYVDDLIYSILRKEWKK